MSQHGVMCARRIWFLCFPARKLRWWKRRKKMTKWTDCPSVTWQINERLMAASRVRALCLGHWRRAAAPGSFTSLGALTSLKRSQMLINTLSYFYPCAHSIWVGLFWVFGPSRLAELTGGKREKAGGIPPGRPARWSAALKTDRRLARSIPTPSNSAAAVKRGS